MLVGKKVADSAAPMSPVTSSSSRGGRPESAPDYTTAIINALPYGVVCFDLAPNNSIIVHSANPHAQSLFGFSNIDELPAPLTSIWTSKQKDSLADKVRETLEKNNQ